PANKQQVDLRLKGELEKNDKSASTLDRGDSLGGVGDPLAGLAGEGGGAADRQVAQAPAGAPVPEPSQELRLDAPSEAPRASASRRPSPRPHHRADPDDPLAALDDVPVTERRGGGGAPVDAPQPSDPYDGDMKAIATEIAAGKTD